MKPEKSGLHKVSQKSGMVTLAYKIPALGRLRQENYEFQATLGYKVYLKTKQRDSGIVKRPTH